MSGTQRGPVKVNLTSAEPVGASRLRTHLPLVVRLIADGEPYALEEMQRDQWPTQLEQVEVPEKLRLVSSM